MVSHLILFDVGNTTVSIGIAAGGSTGKLRTWQLPMTAGTTADAFGLTLSSVLQNAAVEKESLQPAMACSVVPSFDPILRQACARYLGIDVRFVHQDVAVPLENRYARPQEVGADRLMAAWAAWRLLPAPSHIVIDFGTATTFDCVQGRAYLGGLICPGVMSSARALSSQTAKLPQIELDLESDAVTPGRSTKDSLTQGLVFGFACMIDGLVEKLMPLLEDPDSQVAILPADLPHPAGQAIQQHEDAPLVVAAGGLARSIARFTTRIHHVRPALILEGMALLSEEAC